MALDIIIQFVEGRMSSEKFQEHLNTNDELNNILNNNIARPSGIGESLYLFIYRYGIDTLNGKLNVIGALENFLEDNKMTFHKNDELEKLYNLTVGIQPNWLDLPGFYLQKLLDMAGERQGTELKKFLKEEIKQRFKCMKSTPKWIQGASWIFVNEEPLLFVGQLDITEMRHDTSKLYIFLDEKTGNYHTVEQSM